MNHVKIFSLAEMKVDNNRFIHNIKKYYNHYEYDEYLYRQIVIKKCIDKGFLSFEKNKKEIEEFYLYGNNSLFKNNKINDFEFKDIKKYRKRMVYSLLINRDKEIKRILSNEFSQKNAEVIDNVFDFRAYPRTFKEAPNEIFCKDTLKIVDFFSNLIFEKNKKVFAIKIIIHYTIIDALEDIDTSNSPEGIHQDGMDYIVSALVIERSNIIGGISKIYYPNYENKILEIELQEGFGIFQPDINTNLWHEVTNISINDKNRNGFRSTIGFDFEVLQ